MRHTLAAIALSALTLVAYSNSFQAGFALDSRALVLNDPRVHEANAGNVDLILHHTYWWPYGESGLYRPLTTLSYLFNYAVLGNGDRPAGYHWTNVALHALNVLLVFGIALRLVGAFWPSFFAAAVWAVHPILTESVTNIVGRSDLLAATAVLAGFLMYLESTARRRRHRLAWLAGLMAVTTVGVFSKESAVVLIGVVALYEVTWWGGRRRLKDVVLGFLAILLPIAAMLYERANVLAASPPAEFPYVDNPLVDAGFWTGRLTALKVMARYLQLTVWPATLSCDYSFAQIPLARGSLQDWLAWAIVAAVAVIVGFLFRRHRAAFFGACFAFVTFVPVSNLLLPIGTIMAERFLYLPSVGLVLCIVAAIEAAGRRTAAATLAPIVLSVIVGGLAIRTWDRNRDWQDDVTLHTATVAAAPMSFKSHKMLADALYQSDPSRSNLDRVIDEAEKSVSILDAVPDARNDAEMYTRAGAYHLEQGDRLRQSAQAGGPPTDRLESVRAFERSLPLLLRSVAITNALIAHNPHKQTVPRFGDAYRFLSVTYLRLGDSQKAFDAATRACALAPLNPGVYRQLASVHLAANRPEDAAIALTEGLILTADPTLRDLLMNLYRSGLDEEGCALIDRAGDTSFNPQCELVHRHVCDASAEAIGVWLRTGRRNLAESLKNTALRQFACPADRLNAILPDGS